MKNLHPLLQQQVRQHFGDTTDVSPDVVSFLNMVNGIYEARVPIDIKMPKEPGMKTADLTHGDAGPEFTELPLLAGNKDSTYKTLVQTINEGITITDKNGIIQYVSDQFCKMVGVPRQFLIGQDSYAMLPNDDYRSFVKARTLEADTHTVLLNMSFQFEQESENNSTYW